MNLELAWAAGFFDGEGSIHEVRWTLKNGTIRRGIQASVTQKDRRPLDRFAAAMGRGNVRGPYEKHGGQHFLTLSCGPAEEVIKLLWPHLSDPKKEQYLRVKGGDSVELSKRAPI